MTNEISLLKPADFPSQLREMADPPEQLYLEGALPGPEITLLTVVGSRHYSQYGQEACAKLIGGLAGYPVGIVSGLALGIDTLAHQAALAARLPTIAFPGSGLDRSVLPPHSNRPLAEAIVAAGGALVSEFEPLYPAGLHTFPRRNRLMAGLARAVLVVEAAERSGTLITARLALDYNRDVLAVPGSIFALNSQGANRLIRQGATPITSSNDLLEALGFAAPEAQTQFHFSGGTPLEQKVLALLAIETLPRDEVIRALALPTSEANSLLAVMEIKGVITETMGELRLK